MDSFIRNCGRHAWAILSVSILCALSALFITGFDRFPDGIKISEGTVKQVGVNLPVRAMFSPDEEDVGVPVLKVDNKPLTDNINIDLRDNITLTAAESGSATLSLNLFGLPGRSLSLDVLPEYTLIPWGRTVGVRVETDGVMVLGTGDITDEGGKLPSPSSGVLRSGDTITKANGKQLDNKVQFMDIIRESAGDLSLRVRRREEYFDATIRPHVHSRTNERSIGVWIRDDTKGIGTVTYYNPRTNRFAALGHGIVDVDTKQMMNIRSGRIMETDVVSVVKGRKGAPGELLGKVREGS
ncbi:MAG: hypothetical protein FWD98_06195, partial [Defluviitaleaceae bacterium]|nr:hypothetical protein [Defluviitaleaceae bacterium]